MPLNPDAVGTETDPAEARWTSKDSLLYALGVGAGATRPHRLRARVHHRELRRHHQQALPTMPVVISAGSSGGRNPMDAIGTFDYAMLVHGEQSITLHQPVPVEGTATMKGRVAAMYDKGKAAVVVLENEAVDAERRAAVDEHDVGVHPRRGRLGRRPRSERPAQRAAGARPRSRRVVHDPHRPGAALPPQRRPQPAALRPEVRRGAPGSRSRSCTGCARTGSPAGRSCTRCAAATRAVQGDRGPVLAPRHARRHARREDLGRRQRGDLPDLGRGEHGDRLREAHVRVRGTHVRAVHPGRRSPTSTACARTSNVAGTVDGRCRRVPRQHRGDHARRGTSSSSPGSTRQPRQGDRGPARIRGEWWRELPGVPRRRTRA